MPKKILIVEDYQDTRKILRFILEEKGYQVIEAADGDEAIEALEKDTPDLIFMDMSMPGLDGVGVTEIIRAYFGNSDIPIVALTAYGDLFTQKAIQAGCNRVVSKPLDISALENLLWQYLKQ